MVKKHGTTVHFLSPWVTYVTFFYIPCFITLQVIEQIEYTMKKGPHLQGNESDDFS